MLKSHMSVVFSGTQLFFFQFFFELRESRNTRNNTSFMCVLGVWGFVARNGFQTQGMDSRRKDFDFDWLITVKLSCILQHASYILDAGMVLQTYAPPLPRALSP